MPDIWNAEFTEISPCFTQLPDGSQWLGRGDWPTCRELTDLLPDNLCTRSGAEIRFLPQDPQIPYPELYYEQRIYAHGMVATRDANWHDFFNALIWSLFSQSKVMINGLHARDIDGQGNKRRTPQRDALTLFDENGVIIASSSTHLLRHILDFAWKPLFMEESAAWNRQISCFMFGHALLEKMLTPYVGVTAHAMLVEVEPSFFLLSSRGQQAWLDQAVAAALKRGCLISTRNLSPFPLLGVPGWWKEQGAEFYANTGYFRQKNRERNASIISAPRPSAPTAHPWG